MKKRKKKLWQIAAFWLAAIMMWAIADVSAFAGEAECTCESKCTEGSANNECAVCSADYTACNIYTVSVDSTKDQLSIEVTEGTTATAGVDYYGKISLSNRYSRSSDFELIITIGGTATENYSLAAGELYIPAESVTGDIVITWNGELTRVDAPLDACASDHLAGALTPVETTWADDCSSATFSYPCAFCTDTLTADATKISSEVIVESTCSTKGTIRYTATADTLSDTKDVELELAPDTHSFNPATGKCSGCQTELAVASVTINGTTTYYETLAEAATAAQTGTETAPATLKLEQSIDLGTSCLKTTTGVFTFDMNGFKLSGSKDTNGTLTIYGGNVTITDTVGGGAITNSDYAGVGVQLDLCTATIEGGTISGELYGVEISDSAVIINGGTISGNDTEEGAGVFINVLTETETATVTINGGSITGAYCDLYHLNGAIILGLGENGVGATFPGGLSLVNEDGSLTTLTLNTILGEGAAYWQGDKMIFLSENQMEITGSDVTVKKECKHENVTYPTEYITETQHKVVCSCGYEGTVGHTYDKDTHKCACGTVCGTDVNHNLSYSEIQNNTHKETCSECGYEATVNHTYDASTHLCDCGKLETYTVSMADSDRGVKIVKVNGEDVAEGETITVEHGKELTVVLENTASATRDDVCVHAVTVGGTDIDSNIVSDDGCTFTFVAGVITGDVKINVSAYVNVMVNMAGGSVNSSYADLWTVDADTATRALTYYSDIRLADYFEKTGHTLASIKDQESETVYDSNKGISLTSDLSLTLVWKCDTLTHVEAKAATCMAAGNLEYWSCTCGKLYSDADGTTETTLEAVTLAINENAHSYPDTPNSYTETEDTHTEHYICTLNGEHTKDETGKPHTYTDGQCVCGKVCDHSGNKNTYTTTDDEHSFTCSVCEKEVSGEHNPKYSASGATITASCTVCEKELGTVTISAESKTYDGTAVTASISGTGGLADTSAIVITYAVKGGDNLDSAPVNAGTYTASFTLSEKTANVDFTIEPRELTITGATATSRVYDGTNQVVITGVTLNGVADADDVSVNLEGVKGTVDSSNAGTYTLVTLPELTLAGADADNYTLIQPATAVQTSVTIEKADATITVGTSSYDKTYGDADFALENVQDTNLEADVTYSSSDENVVTVSNGTVTIKGAGTATITVSLASSTNYNAAESKTITVTVDKKTGYTVEELNRSYYYAKENSDSIDLADLLPTDCGSVSYGTPTTAGTTVTYSTAPSITNGVLSYKVASGSVGNSGTITVVVTTQNYADITITVNVSLTDQLTVSVKEGEAVSLNNDILTYGEALSKLTFKDVTFVDDSGNAVEGTLAWKEPSLTPNAGATSATWVFAPSDVQYQTIEGTVAITVNKATPTVSAVPTVAERTYHPATALADTDLSGGTVTGVDGNALTGTWSWQSTGIIPVVNSSGYAAVFTPTDTTNYDTVTRTITVPVTKATPVVVTLPTAATITYGDALSASSLSGTAQYSSSDNTTVAGSFAWKDAERKPSVADSDKTAYTVVFTPEDTVNYNTVETAITLTIHKAEAAPNMPSGTMNVAYSVETVGAVTLPTGWSWKDSEKSVALTVGETVSATAIYTGSDTGNYEKETVVVSITRSDQTYYTITVTAGQGGTASSSALSAPEGTLITLTATPDEGYTFSGWTSSDVTISDDSFTMPDKDVTVTAKFAEVEEDDGTEDIPGDDDDSGDDTPGSGDDDNDDTDDTDNIDEILEIAENALNGITATNSTTATTLKNKVVRALKKAGYTGVTVTVENFEKTRATSSRTGEITAEIGLETENSGGWIWVELTIAKLSSSDSSGGSSYYPTATPIPVPTATPTPAPTAAPVPTATPTPAYNPESSWITEEISKAYEAAEQQYDVLLGTSAKDASLVRTMEVGGTIDLNFYGVKNWKRDDYTAKWTSSDESIATVNNVGVVTMLDEGMVIIRLELTYKATGEKLNVAPCIIGVPEAVYDVFLGISKEDTGLQRELPAGSTIDLNFYGVKNWKKEDYEYEWISSDETVATVNKVGVVTAQAPGMTVIRLKLKNKATGEYLVVAPVVFMVPEKTEE